MRTPRHIALCLALAACGVEPVDDEPPVELMCQVDQDGDGVDACNAAGSMLDCDDLNPRVAPGFAEVPYDGHDNDCEGGDVLDVDGDGFPGVSQHFYTAAHPDAPWPEELNSKEDCWDAPHPSFPEVDPSTVYPGAHDAWYDGVDSDCGMNDDYDRDYDGYASASESEGYAGPLPATDCDDYSPWINPGQIGYDQIYDGVDQDCQRDNDYDGDGDGFVAPALQDAYIAYVAKTGFDLPPWDEVAGDWLDLAHSSFTYDSGAAVQPGVIHPGAVDPPYNGIDEACDDIDGDLAVGNDFDVDGDGVMAGGYEDAFVRYYLRYRSLAGPDAIYTAYKDAFRAFGVNDQEARLYYRTHSGDVDDDDENRW